MVKDWGSRVTSWTKFICPSISWAEPLLEQGWEKVPIWECTFVHRTQGFVSVGICGWHRNWWREAEYVFHVQEIDEKVDIDNEHTSFLDRVYLECTQREWKPSEATSEQCKKMFDSRISFWSNGKFPGWDKPQAQTKSPSCWNWWSFKQRLETWYSSFIFLFANSQNRQT